MRIWTLTIGFFCCIIACWLLFLSQSPNHPPTLTESTSQNNQHTITIKQITLHEYSKNKNYELVITAEQSAFDHRSESVSCLKTSCSILKHGAQIAWMKTAQSLIDRSNKTITCVGATQGAMQELTFEGSNVSYNFVTQIGTTHSPITYTHPLFKLSAQQSDIDTQKQTVFMSNGVRTEFLNLTNINK